MFDKKAYAKQWRKDNQEKIKRDMKEYCIKNKERILGHKRKWRKNNPELVKEYHKRWYMKNKEECSNYNKQWRKNNLEHTKEVSKRWYKNHPEYRKQYYQKNRGKALKQSQQYHKNNLDKFKESLNKYKKSEKGRASCQRSKIKRRAREREMINTLTAKEWLKILKKYKFKCAYCNCEFTLFNRETRDHIIPISKGGHNTKENVVPACQSCNSKKNNKILYIKGAINE